LLSAVIALAATDAASVSMIFCMTFESSLLFQSAIALCLGVKVQKNADCPS
jgi:hypothetical protein